jgi:hypothetical protein
VIDVKTDLNWNGEDVKVKGKKVMNKSLFELGLIIEGQAKVLAPVKTGRLAGSITTQSRTEGTKPDGNAKSSDVITKPSRDEEVFVGTAVDYAPHIEYGTSSYIIKAKNARSLSDGKSYFGKSVTHPGIDAQPFLRPSLALAQGKTLRTFEENGKRYFADYMRK